MFTFPKRLQCVNTLKCSLCAIKTEPKECSSLQYIDMGLAIIKYNIVTDLSGLKKAKGRGMVQAGRKVDDPLAAHRTNGVY